MLNVEPLYLEDFGCREDIENQFSDYGWNYEKKESRKGDVLLSDNVQILIAEYTYEDYSGNAFVLYYDTNDGKLYEVTGAHCSCYGLEGQWEPEEANIDAIIKYSGWSGLELAKLHEIKEAMSV